MKDDLTKIKESSGIESLTSDLEKNSATITMTHRNIIL